MLWYSYILKCLELLWNENKKTGLNGLIKCSKLEKKNECKLTANFCFRLLYCEHVEDKSKGTRKSFHNMKHVAGRPPWPQIVGTKLKVDFSERSDPSNYKIGLEKVFHRCPFFLIEAEVEAMGQKWEFGQAKNNLNINFSKLEDVLLWPMVNFRLKVAQI